MSKQTDSPKGSIYSSLADLDDRPCLLCEKPRYGLYKFCSHHSNWWKTTGYPEQHLLPEGALDALTEVVIKWIEEKYLSDVNSAKIFAADFKRGLDSVSFPSGWAIPYSEFHRRCQRGAYDKLTRRERGKRLLAHYKHTAKKPLPMVFYRYMANRLYAALRVQPIIGFKETREQLDFFAIMRTGSHVTECCGLKVPYFKDVVTFEKSIHASALGDTQVKAKTTTVKKFSRLPILTNARAAGLHIAEAVDTIFLKGWYNDPDLIKEASSVLNVEPVSALKAASNYRKQDLREMQETEYVNEYKGYFPKWLEKQLAP